MSVDLTAGTVRVLLPDGTPVSTDFVIPAETLRNLALMTIPLQLAS